MARNEVTVNVQLDDKQLKSLADEIRETFAKRIEELESRIAKVRELAARARALPTELCRCSSTVGGHDIGCPGVVAAVAWTLDPQEILLALDGEHETRRALEVGGYVVNPDIQFDVVDDDDNRAVPDGWKQLMPLLDEEDEKATGGILKPGEAYTVGEAGCSLPHMPFPKGGIPTGQKVTIHVPDEWKQLMPFFDEENTEGGEEPTDA